jgi:hypothetical protein
VLPKTCPDTGDDEVVRMETRNIRGEIANAGYDARLFVFLRTWLAYGTCGSPRPALALRSERAKEQDQAFLVLPRQLFVVFDDPVGLAALT